jgi:hypothetical protein
VDDLGFDSWKGQEIFLFFKKCRLGSGVYPAFFAIGAGVLSLSIQWLEHVDHSPPYVYKVKNKWNHISASLFAVMVWAWTTLPLPSSIGSIVMEAELSQND